ncbi:hypothetical protein ACWT_5733 [Actinoplanes sp. SE50]|uniref:hypothetical protein n=1 Tax=unclassified Actinoplanes TaxID=2626549 RepID=UPI00023ED4C1|nr:MULTISPECIES: hypothetical protein [unclassified Actinoplanes]AEV86751.1 hypothetical protein ACPL_5864 [Actinoplanes sp. SE50/110]ATO85148.1 hypothetical protein ACWT_5733 [Actinoplanes sp. SE50]SLM02559.1 uncharacterized protein ACSP50_5809 [Actinoplanes sp. SE50/110]
MSHLHSKRLAGVAVAATAGLLLLAAPAQAAPSAGAANATPKPPAPTAAEIEANNAAVRASLPSNVTMTVMGKLPKLEGPIDHYTQDGPTTTTGVSTFAVATLPFSFTFTHFWDHDGREFRSAHKTVCMDIEAEWDIPQGSYHKFKVGLRGSDVTVPTDGVARSYCWSGVPTNTIINFYYYSTENVNGDIAKASGSGRVRYS